MGRCKACDTPCAEAWDDYEYQYDYDYDYDYSRYKLEQKQVEMKQEPAGQITARVELNEAEPPQGVN